MIIFKEFTFDSAHALPYVPDDHKCKRVHGHTYRLKVLIEGDLDPKLAWVMDFALIKDVIKPIIDEVDHRYLNDVEGLENPTCEVLCIWIWDRIISKIPGLKRLELNETPTSGAIYEGV